MYKIINIFHKLKSSHLVNDSFWALAGSALGKGLSLLSSIYIARFLGKEIFGEYGTIKNTLVYIAIVSTFGFGYSATKYVVEYLKSKNDRISSLVQVVRIITLIFSIVLAFLFFVFAEQISIFFDAPHIVGRLRISSFIVVVNAINATQIGILSGFKVFKKIAINDICFGIVVFISSLILTYIYGLNGAIIALLISYTFQIIFNDIILRKELLQYKGTRKLEIGRNEIKTMLKFSCPIALQESLYCVVHWLNTILIIKYGNYGEVGILSVSSQWVTLLLFIPSMLKNVIFSYMSSVDNRELLLKKLVIIYFVATFVPVLVVCLLSNQICNFYGVSFTFLKPVLIINVFSTIFIAVSEVYSYELIVIGKPWQVFYSRILRDSAILLVCMFLFIYTQFQESLIAVVISLFFNIIYLGILFLYYRRNQYVREE